jgi:NitT/TauT family transport system permease protein
MTHFIISHNRRKIISFSLVAAFWLFSWQLLSSMIGQELLLASPVSTLRALIRLMGTEGFYLSALNSFSRIFMGFMIATAVGVIFAAVALVCKPVGVLLGPLMWVIKATPVASFVIIALLWVSSRNLSILTGFLMVLPIMYTNIYHGLRSADIKIIEMARVFQLNAQKTARAAYLPAAYPHFVSACELSLGLCWKAGIAAEVIGQPARTIGDMLYQAKLLLNTPDLFAWTLTVILLSVALERGALSALRAINTRIGGRGDGHEG